MSEATVCTIQYTYTAYTLQKIAPEMFGCTVICCASTVNSSLQQTFFADIKLVDTCLRYRSDRSVIHLAAKFLFVQAKKCRMHCNRLSGNTIISRVLVLIRGKVFVFFQKKHLSNLKKPRKDTIAFLTESEEEEITAIR